jgi:hypothetical protein
MTRAALAFLAVVALASPLRSEDDVLRLGMGGLSRLSRARTRSISPENFTGEKGKGGSRELTVESAFRDRVALV